MLRIVASWLGLRPEARGHALRAVAFSLKPFYPSTVWWNFVARRDFTLFCQAPKPFVPPLRRLAETAFLDCGHVVYYSRMVPRGSTPREMSGSGLACIEHCRMFGFVDSKWRSGGIGVAGGSKAVAGPWGGFATFVGSSAGGPDARSRVGARQGGGARRRL